MILILVLSESLLPLPLDINECEDPGDNPTCHEHANCTDTEGSYECTCNSGFSGNGFNCSGLDTIGVLPISSGTIYILIPSYNHRYQ